HQSLLPSLICLRDLHPEADGGGCRSDLKPTHGQSIAPPAGGEQHRQEQGTEGEPEGHAARPGHERHDEGAGRGSAILWVGPNALTWPCDRVIDQMTRPPSPSSRSVAVDLVHVPKAGRESKSPKGLTAHGLTQGPAELDGPATRKTHLRGCNACAPRRDGHTVVSCFVAAPP